MANIGRRILYDNITGEIIDIFQEISGDSATARPTWNGATYLDIPYGQNEDEFSRLKTAHVDISTKTVIFDELNPKTISAGDANKILTKSLFSINKALVQQNGTAETLKEIVGALKSLGGEK